VAEHYDSKAAQARALRKKRDKEWEQTLREEQERNDAMERCASDDHDYCRRLMEKIDV
jgi:hypothetical protein